MRLASRLISISWVLLIASLGVRAQDRGIRDFRGDIDHALSRSMEAANTAARAANLELADQYARENGRDGLPALVQGFIHHPFTDENQSDFVERAIVDVADPDDQHGFKTSPCWDYWDDAAKLCVAAIGDMNDRQSLEMLIQLATDRYTNPSTESAVSQIVCGLLRGLDDPEPFRQVEERLKSDTPYEQRQNLRAMLASVRYRESLKGPEERAAYRHFEHVLWRSWALTPRSHDVGVTAIYSNAAGAILKEMKEIDHRFLLRILQDPLSTEPETYIATSLIVGLRAADLKPELTAIAESKSPKARFAKEALDDLARPDFGGLQRQPTTRTDRP